MNSNKWLPLIALIGIACLGLGIYSISQQRSTATIPVAPSPPVQVAQDSKTCTVVVPATAAYGVNCIDASTGRKFEVKAGDDIDVTASGSVQVGIDRPTVGPEGEKTGYFDTGVDSPYTQNIGGLEMWIGVDRKANRYLIGSRFHRKISDSGVPSFRVIDKLPMIRNGSQEGYRGTGAFTVTITKR